VLYTPGVVNTPRIIQRDVEAVWAVVFGLADRLHQPSQQRPRAQSPDLVIIDEADRLKTAGLEQLRDLYDRRHIGLVLIGMPGLQKRLARYAQLYSRVGFVHQFMSLGGSELQDVIRRQSLQLGLGLEAHDGTDAGVLNSIVRITGGNFRLVERLFAQIERVTQINDLSTLMLPFEAEQFELALNRTRERLEPAEFTRAWEAGREVSLHEAIRRVEELAVSAGGSSP